MWVLGVLAGLSVGVAQAAPIVNVESSEGQFFNTEGSLSFESTGADLDGAIVTACFFEADCYEEIWQGSGISGKAEGEVQGDGEDKNNEWILSLSGDSFSNDFFFDNFGPLGLMSFSVNTIGSNAFFDIETSDTDATDGTQRGQPFTLSGTLFDESEPEVTDINVTYSNQLTVGGTIIPNSQLFTFMQVNFLGGDNFTGFRGFFNFLSDTDRTTTSITPITPIPEPNTLTLFASGLLIGFLAWRRRQNPKA
jgi:hypothetical protein